ncbi:MAG: chromate transporter [Paenibacillaceae bacterium]
MLWDLFWSFFKIGLFSFGGGYAMIPVIQHEALAHHWMTETQYAEGVTLAGMSPGPIATNSAIYVGYHTVGIVGSVVATVGIILPSLIVIVLISVIFNKLYEHKTVQAVFYGLRPVIVALIFFAAIRLAFANPMLHGGISKNTWIAGLIFLAAFTGLIRYKMHPLVIILLAGLVGIAVYE